MRRRLTQAVERTDTALSHGPAAHLLRVRRHEAEMTIGTKDSMEKKNEDQQQQQFVGTVLDTHMTGACR
jgi:hypothetical protein